MKRTTSSVITANIYHTSVRKRVHFNEKETLQKAASQRIIWPKGKGESFFKCTSGNDHAQTRSCTSAAVSHTFVPTFVQTCDPLSPAFEFGFV